MAAGCRIMSGMTRTLLVYSVIPAKAGIQDIRFSICIKIAQFRYQSDIKYHTLHNEAVYDR